MKEFSYIEFGLYFLFYIKTVLFVTTSIIYWRYYQAKKHAKRTKGFLNVIVIFIIIYIFTDTVDSFIVNKFGKQIYYNKNKFQDSIYINNKFTNNETKLRIDSLINYNLDQKLIDSIERKYNKDINKSNLELLPLIIENQKMSERNSLRIDSNKERINKNRLEIEKIIRNDNRSR